jgi:hypothetical protein
MGELIAKVKIIAEHLCRSESFSSCQSGWLLPMKLGAFHDHSQLQALNWVVAKS